ncbi:predicted protein [Sparassis crispa]|uniref:Uncharacterized protein n=1 Tax=Sparassis crispa TaxID=139825 RepID=A0A401GHI7_9APHY|nr:predicted protein [Sparassis crispa]GBE81575.1 predicted protein [Sparassis crispa]
MSNPEPLPSLPPSPVEEDLSRARPWEDEETSMVHSSSSDAVRRGKEREVEVEPAPETLYANEGEDAFSEGASTSVDEYPPVNDEEAESRRVEENLRLWEMAERQRRKAARENTNAASSSGTTLVGDITRKASLLWPSRRMTQASMALGAHRELRTTDDGVPLDDIEASPSPGTSTRTSFELVENPFITPAASTTSLNEPTQSAIMTESTSVSPLHGEQGGVSATPAPEHPTLQALSSTRKPPPPQSLNLPRPRTPPPPNSPPHANRPPEPTLTPTLTPPPTVQEDEPPVRWWTEWLCGCSEGSDRGGEHQAGRTNPFE